MAKEPRRSKSAMHTAKTAVIYSTSCRVMIGLLKSVRTRHFTHTETAITVPAQYTQRRADNTPWSTVTFASLGSWGHPATTSFLICLVILNCDPCGNGRSKKQKEAQISCSSKLNRSQGTSFSLFCTIDHRKTLNYSIYCRTIATSEKLICPNQ